MRAARVPGWGSGRAHSGRGLTHDQSKRTMTHPGRKLTRLLLFCAPLGACYSYAALPADDRSRSADVRMDIEPAGAERVAALLGPRVQTLEGRLVASTDSTLTVAVEGITRSGGYEEHWNGDAVRVPRSAVARMQVRRFDAIKSALIAGGIVGGALAAGRAASGTSTTSARGATPGARQ